MCLHKHKLVRSWLFVSQKMVTMIFCLDGDTWESFQWIYMVSTELIVMYCQVYDEIPMSLFYHKLVQKCQKCHFDFYNLEGSELYYSILCVIICQYLWFPMHIKFSVG